MTLPQTPLPPSAILLLGANAVPLLGVLFFGWDLFSIMVLYWAENGVIGLLNVPKIFLASGTAKGPTPHAGPPSGSSAPASAAITNTGAKLLVIPFFVFHYGVFWTVHGVFVFALFGPPQGPTTTVAIAALVLFASHGASFLVNYVGQREYLETYPQAQMHRPYARVLVLHVTIVAGGLLTLLLGSPVAALALLVVLKTAVDLRSHLGEHATAREDATTRPPA